MTATRAPGAVASATVVKALRPVQHSERGLPPFMSPYGFRVLLALAASPRPGLDARQVAHAAGMDPALVPNQLADLEALGLVERGRMRRGVFALALAGRAAVGPAGAVPHLLGRVPDRAPLVMTELYRSTRAAVALHLPMPRRTRDELQCVLGHLVAASGDVVPLAQVLQPADPQSCAGGRLLRELYPPPRRRVVEAGARPPGTGRPGVDGVVQMPTAMAGLDSLAVPVRHGGILCGALSLVAPPYVLEHHVGQLFAAADTLGGSPRTVRRPAAASSAAGVLDGRPVGPGSPVRRLARADRPA